MKAQMVVVKRVWCLHWEAQGRGKGVRRRVAAVKRGGEAGGGNDVVDGGVD